MDCMQDHRDGASPNLDARLSCALEVAVSRCMSALACTLADRMDSVVAFYRSADAEEQV